MFIFSFKDTQFLTFDLFDNSPSKSDDWVEYPFAKA